MLCFTPIATMGNAVGIFNLGGGEEITAGREVNTGGVGVGVALVVASCCFEELQVTYID